MIETPKTFFLGVGGAKCGTSWLFDYLSSHPQFAAPPIKELHTFAQRAQPTYLHSVIRLPWHRFAGRKWLRENLFKAWLRADHRRYLRMFEKLLAPAHIKSTGEFSTSYMWLDAEDFARIVEMFSQRNIRIVIGLLMRDPVDRFCSEKRFQRRLRNTNRYRANDSMSVEELIESELAHPAEPLYVPILEILNEHLRHDQQFVSLYEDLFDQSKVENLTRMLGMDAFPGQFGKQVNATPQQSPLPPELLARLARHLAPDYAAAVGYFGRDHIAKHWPHLRLSGV